MYDHETATTIRLHMFQPCSFDGHLFYPSLSLASFRRCTRYVLRCCESFLWDFKGRCLVFNGSWIIKGHFVPDGHLPGSRTDGKGFREGSLSFPVASRYGGMWIPAGYMARSSGSPQAYEGLKSSGVPVNYGINLLFFISTCVHVAASATMLYTLVRL